MYTFFRSLHCFFNLSIQQISTIGTSELQILPAPVATLWRSNYSIRRWISEAKTKRMWAGRDTWLWTSDGFGSISIYTYFEKIQYYYVLLCCNKKRQSGWFPPPQLANLMDFPPRFPLGWAKNTTLTAKHVLLALLAQACILSLSFFAHLAPCFGKTLHFGGSCRGCLVDTLHGYTKKHRCLQHKPPDGEWVHSRHRWSSFRCGGVAAFVSPE